VHRRVRRLHQQRRLLPGYVVRPPAGKHARDLRTVRRVEQRERQLQREQQRQLQRQQQWLLERIVERLLQRFVERRRLRGRRVRALRSGLHDGG
jgi:hypothetical protein